MDRWSKPTTGSTSADERREVEKLTKEKSREGETSGKSDIEVPPMKRPASAKATEEESSDSESYLERNVFKHMKDSRSMSVGERLEIIGQLANPKRATRTVFCIPPPPKKLEHSMGMAPKWGKFGVPFAKDLS